MVEKVAEGLEGLEGPVQVCVLCWDQQGRGRRLAGWLAGGQAGQQQRLAVSVHSPH